MKDSESRRDIVLGRKFSLLDDKESLEVTRVTVSVSFWTERLMIHSCSNAADAVILFTGSGCIILDMRSCANDDICNSDGKMSDELEQSLEHKLSSLESSSEKIKSSDLNNDVREGGVPQRSTYKVTPNE
jgi:hypothetical protein